ADALRVAADDGDVGDAAADEGALVGDDHHLIGVGDLQRGDYVAVALAGLDVDDALAAAVREPVLLERGALAVAVFGDGQERAAGARQLRADHLIVALQRDALDAEGCAAHGADFALIEADGHAAS